MSKEFIGLRASDGITEYNARFLLGDTKAEALEFGKWYTAEELGDCPFIETTGASAKQWTMKWRRIGIND